MADLWRMTQGRLRAQRSLVLAQAALVWCLGKMTPSNIEDFVQRGTLSPEGDERDAQKIPFNGDLIKRMIRG